MSRRREIKLLFDELAQSMEYFVSQAETSDELETWKVTQPHLYQFYLDSKRATEQYRQDCKEAP